MTANLLTAIGTLKLTQYFEFLDDLRDSGVTNMYGAASYLIDEYPGMAREEARAVLQAWMKTFTGTTPAEDRADAAISA